MGKHAPVAVVLRRLYNMFRLSVSLSASYLRLGLLTFIQKNKAIRVNTIIRAKRGQVELGADPGRDVHLAEA